MRGVHGIELDIKTVFSCALLLMLSNAHAGIPIFFDSGGEVIEKYADLPKTDQFVDASWNHIDLGYIYKRVRIFFIPVWHYDIRWCGYVNSKVYIPWDRDAVAEAARLAGLNLPEKPPVGGFIHFVLNMLCLALVLGALGGLAHLIKNAGEEKEAAT